MTSKTNRFGSYTLFAEIGEDWLGTSFRARRDGDDEDVVVQVFHPSLAADPTFVERHARAISKSRRLEHPAIIGYRDLVREGEAVALVSDLFEGQPLSDIIRNVMGPLSWSWAGPVFTRLLGAVGFAHERGLVHGYLREDEVLVNHAGDIRIPGFPDALEEGSAYRRPAFGRNIHVAPEQIAGGETRVDRRFDIYALGMILYVMMAGRGPWEGGEVSAFQELQDRLAGRIPSPHTWYPIIPGRVVTATMTALSLRPEDRFPTTTAFAAALGL